jgi:hypothetical protein
MPANRRLGASFSLPVVAAILVGIVPSVTTAAATGNGDRTPFDVIARAHGFEVDIPGCAESTAGELPADDVIELTLTDVVVAGRKVLGSGGSASLGELKLRLHPGGQLIVTGVQATVAASLDESSGRIVCEAAETEPDPCSLEARLKRLLQTTFFPGRRLLLDTTTRPPLPLPTVTTELHAELISYVC